jgi:hypothetical protein
MGGIDIGNITYLGFRLAPFIIIFYFLFQSFLNFEIRGVVYIAGMIVSSSLVYLSNGLLNSMFGPESHTGFPNSKCNIISLGENGNVLSNIPLSLCVYSYTFFYLLTFMVMSGGDAYTALAQNIPTLVIFPLLSGAEMFWLASYHCIRHPVEAFIMAVVISGGVAVAWGAAIIKVGNNKLFYINNADTGQVCSRPSKQMFRCKPQKI